MLDVLIVVYTLAAHAPEMGEAVMDAVPPTGLALELEAQKKQTPVDAAASTAAQIAAHEAWHAEQEAAAKKAAEQRRAAATVPSGSVWDRLAQCESGGRWDLNVGTYDGGLQFHPKTWLAAGGGKYAPYAWQASREQQIAIAESWLARTSWAQWPACSRKLGLR